MVRPGLIIIWMGNVSGVITLHIPTLWWFQKITPMQYYLMIKAHLDPDDDIYHHAFRIGFNSPNAGNTINSFNLKRWFNNESTNAENSPGFNITEALEFFPEDGTSVTQGYLKVIEQDLVIAGTNGNSYTISIEGEGEYHEIEEGIYQMTFVLRATNLELFGGTRTVHYVLYNTDTYEDPAGITEECFQPIDL